MEQKINEDEFENNTSIKSMQIKEPLFEIRHIWTKHIYFLFQFNNSVYL